MDGVSISTRVITVEFPLLFWFIFTVFIKKVQKLWEFLARPWQWKRKITGKKQNLLENWDGTRHLLDVSTHLAYSDNCYFHPFFIVCLIELKFCKVSWNSISKWTWKFQLSLLKNKKNLFLKKNFFGPLSISKQKSFVYSLNFPEGFGIHILLQKEV